jgi:hypothetical protein
MGVAVGRKTAVGGRGWKGVAVAVALTGLNRKSWLMLTAAGAPTGKLQAEVKLINANRMKGSFLRIDLLITGI